MGNQNTVEARLFVSLSEGAHVVDVDCGTVRYVCFGYFVLLDHTDEFDAHVGSLVLSVPAGRTVWGSRAAAGPCLHIQCRLSPGYAYVK
jgi:hypothetical protein